MALRSEWALVRCLALVALGCGASGRQELDKASSGGMSGSGASPGGAGTAPSGGTGGSGAAPGVNSGGSMAGAAGGLTAGGGGGAGNAGSGGANAGSSWLVFRDDFDTLDLGRWQLMTHSWDGNLALFSASSAEVENGELVLRLLNAPSGTVDSTGSPKSFFGAEVRSRDTITYGRVRARARLARGSAAISALVTIYTPWPAPNWNEFDIECLGKDPANIQFNA